MKVVRQNVFETNSSSTHSLSLRRTDRKFTKTGKLLEGNTYTYQALGYKRGQKKFSTSFISEYDKLCVCFDLLFLDFINKSWTSNDRPDRLERYRQSPNDSHFLLLNRYYLKKFLKSNYYREFNMVLKKHNISFEITNDVLNGCDSGVGDRKPVYCDSFDGSGFDFMYHFSHWHFQSISEAIDTIVFNPNFIIEFTYSRGF